MIFSVLQGMWVLEKNFIDMMSYVLAIIKKNYATNNLIKCLEGIL